jgi:hypothetical protein
MGQPFALVGLADDKPQWFMNSYHAGNGVDTGCVRADRGQEQGETAWNPG